MKTVYLIPLYRAFSPSPSGAFHAIPDSEFYTTEYVFLVILLDKRVSVGFDSLCVTTLAF